MRRLEVLLQVFDLSVQRDAEYVDFLQVLPQVVPFKHVEGIETQRVMGMKGCSCFRSARVS